MNANQLARIRDFMVLLMAIEMNKPISDVAILFYYGIVDKMEYPL